MAKELAMVEGNEKGKQARRYFIECEKRLKEVVTKPMTTAQMFALQAQALWKSNRGKMSRMKELEG